MPGVTNSQGLIYPTGGDRPCDFPGQWGDMADILQSKITDVQRIVNRTFPVVPAVLLEKTDLSLAFINTVTSTNTIEFDRVAMDTDNMSNLSADRTSIRPTRPGLYQVVGYAESTTSGDPNNWIQFNVTALGSGVTGLTSFFDSAFIGDNGDNWQKQFSLSNFVSWDPDSGPPTAISCEVTYGGNLGGTGIRVGYVSLGVYWWSDLP